MAPRKPCPQCVAQKRTGGQCKIHTCKYHKKCYVHSVHQDGLKIDKSTIRGAGQGLYTLKDRDKGEMITQYLGKKKTRAQIEQKYPGDTQAPYVVKAKGTDKFIDASQPPAGMARYANHGNVRNQNAKLATTRQKKVVIKATKKIRVPHGRKKEILVDYGKEFWKRNPSRQHAHRRA